MGIYSDGGIYGIMFSLNDVVIFEKYYTEKMDKQQISEAKDYYMFLSEEHRNNIKILFYTYCSSSCDRPIIETSMFMTWLPGDKAILERLFNGDH